VLDYKIIATLGPSSATIHAWESMSSAGVTGFRLNTSHLTLPQLYSWLEKLHPFLASSGLKLVLDLQGSKWRLGFLPPYELVKGQSVTLVLEEITDQSNILPVPHPDFFQSAILLASNPSSTGYRSADILINDAKITLLMESASCDRVTARVNQGGLIMSNKGITFTASEYRQEILSNMDKSIIMATRNLQFIRYAISYVKDAVAMEKFRSLLSQPAVLIAKLERRSAIEDVAKIADLADELWLCRGDLGAELGLKNLAEQVYCFSKNVRNISKPVLMAGQVLEHMNEHPIPTRSEICFLYETLMHGYHGFVLSDETAIGKNPIASCQMAAVFKGSR